MRGRAHVAGAVLALVLAVGCGEAEPDGPPHAIASAEPTTAGAEPIVSEDEWYWLVRIEGAGSTEEAITGLGDDLGRGWAQVALDDTRLGSSTPTWARASFVEEDGSGGGLVWWAGSLDDYVVRSPLASPFRSRDVDEAGEQASEVLVVQQGALDDRP